MNPLQVQKLRSQAVTHVDLCITIFINLLSSVTPKVNIYRIIVTSCRCEYSQ